MRKETYNLILKMIEDIEIECNLNKNRLEDVSRKRFLKDILFDLHEIRRNIKKGRKYVK